MNKMILVTGAICGLLAVVLGAFGAHGLEKFVDPHQIDSFNTGVRYQMYHALLLLFLGSTSFIPDPSKKKLFYFFVTGMFLFSGSIYFLVIDEIIGIDISSLAFLTPIGGLFLIAGWGILIFSIIRLR